MNKKNIRLILLVWDVVAALLIFFSLIMIFETMIKKLLIDSNIHVFNEVIDNAQVENRNAMSFLEGKPDLPYGESVAAVADFLKDFSLGGLKHDRSLVMVLSRDPAWRSVIGLKKGDIGADWQKEIDYRALHAAAAGIPTVLSPTEYESIGKKAGAEDLKRLDFFYKQDHAAKQALLTVFPNQGEAAVLRRIFSDAGLPAQENHVEFSFLGRPYIGSAAFLSSPVHAGLERNKPETFNPVIVAADAQEDFFFRINVIRDLFLAVLGGIIAVVFAIKVINVRNITKEIKEISGTIEDESRAIERQGEIGTALRKLQPRFRETSSLYDSYSHLSGKLLDVGEIISGIADRDLFVATLKNDSSLLDPHETDMAILFLDVEGFTSVAERYKAKAMSIINAIWSAVEKAADRQRGKINKYMGDAALVIFPQGQPAGAAPAAQRAVGAAMEIISGVPELGRRLGISFKFRIGIDYGRLVYGKTGSDRNYELGVIGDPVNTASRCEGLNKRFGTHILITGEALRQACFQAGRAHVFAEAGECVFFLADKVRPHGKKEAKSLYTVMIKESGGMRLAGGDEAFPPAVLESYARLQEEMSAGLAVWGRNKKDGERKWAELAKQAGRLAAASHFAPACALLSLLLANEELARFEANPAGWLKAEAIRIKEPAANWLEYGSVEIPK
jgi:class 3 adenylate cyclase